MALMAHAADGLVTTALTNGCPRYRWKAARVRPTAEVPAVRAVMLCGISRVGARWRKWLRPLCLEISTSAIFCHQTPKVRATNGSVTSCELADLLIVVDFGKDGIHGRRASLIQAKTCAPSGRIDLRNPGELNQLALYVNWPEFQFEKTATYGSDRFDVLSTASPGTMPDGSRYGGIDLDQGSERWVDLTPARVLQMNGGLPLGEYVTRMAFGLAGRTAIPGAPDDWSKLIDLLLEVARKETYGRTNPFPRHRSSSSRMFSYLDSGGAQGRLWQYMGAGFRREVFHEAPPKHRELDRDPDERPDGALSTLHITISEG